MAKRTRSPRSEKLNEKWAKNNQDAIKRIEKGQKLSISVGPRFVFFSSLQGRTGIYREPLSIGTNLVNQAQSALMAGQQGISSNSEQIKHIQDYINFIGQAAKNQLSLESSFLSKVESKVQDETTKILIRENRDKINPTSKTFDYKTFIVILNKVSTQIDNFTKKRRQILINNAKLIEDNLKEQEKVNSNIREQINESMQQGYNKFQKKLNEEELLQKRQIEGDVLEFNSGVHDIMAQKISSIIYQISNSQEIIELLTNLIVNNNIGTKLSNNDIAQQISAAVVDYIFSQEYDTLKQPSKVLREKFLQHFTNKSRNYNATQIERIATLTAERAVKSIQQQALITQRDVGALFNSLTQISQNEIIQKYQIDQQTVTKINKLLTDLAAVNQKQTYYAAKKGQLTKILKQAIFAKYNQFTDLTIEKRKERFAQLQKTDEDFISKSQLRTSVANALKIKFQASSVSQYIEAKLIEKMTHMIASGHVKMMGDVIKMKTDIGFSYQLGKLEGITDAKAINNIEKQISEFTEKFVTNYSTKTKNEVKVDIAQDTYIEQQKQLLKKIQQQASKTDGDAKAAIESLQNFFTTEISQKEYTKGGNFGFEGGSLGGGGAPDAVLENIYTMYQKGGISPIDKQLLYFSAINCSQAALGASLKIPLEQYLLGAAALMMFDSGFTATTNYLNRMKSELGFNARGSLHLFSLQGGNLIPASFLYSSIYNALSQAYQGIIDKAQDPLFKTAQAGSRVTVSNSLSDADIPAYSIMPVPQQRWEYISSIASSEINISFTFLAGMLDIFEAIQAAFNM